VVVPRAATAVAENSVRGEKSMSRVSSRRRTGAGRQVASLVQLALEPLFLADLVLLCSFGPDLHCQRTGRELRHALRRAGYGGPLGRHLVLTNPMLQLCSKDLYVLRPFIVSAPPDSRDQT
jgi:hypothetical protein